MRSSLLIIVEMKEKKKLLKKECIFPGTKTKARKPSPLRDSPAPSPIRYYLNPDSCLRVVPSQRWIVTPNTHSSQIAALVCHGYSRLVSISFLCWEERRAMMERLLEGGSGMEEAGVEMG